MSISSGVHREQAGFSLHHEIFVLDAFLHGALDIDERQEITRGFIAEVLETLGMSPLGPLAVYAATDQRAPGWSFVQPITTSHVSAHYFERPGRLPNIRLDAYSCEAFRWQDIVRLCHRHFGLETWQATLIRRGLDLDESRDIRSISGAGDRVLVEQRLQPFQGGTATETSDAQPLRNVG